MDGRARDRRATGTLAANTLAEYETALRLHILPSFGSHQLRAIRPDELIAWHRELAARGYAADTVRTYWMPLRLVLAYAVRYRLLPDNPADQLVPNERPTTGVGRKRFLSNDEMRRLLAAAPPRYRVAIATGLFSGLRVAEVLGLVWGNVDFAQGELHVRAQMGRDGKRQRLKTGAAMRDVISCHSSHTNSSDTGWQAAPRTRATLPSRRGGRHHRHEEPHRPRHALDLAVEGVEDQSGLDLLVDCGCDFAQGHHFSRLLPADEVAAWARQDAAAASESV